MILDKGHLRFKIVELRKAKPLGKYQVSVKRMDIPYMGYENLFYAATKKVALRQIRKMAGQS